MKPKLQSTLVSNRTTSQYRYSTPTVSFDVRLWVKRLLAVLLVVSLVVALAWTLHGTVLGILFAFAIGVAGITAVPFLAVRGVAAGLSRFE